MGDGLSPAPPAKPTSRAGDLWRCGAHRVLAGDATNPEHVTRVLGDLRPLLMTVDPPYGVSLDPLWRQEAGLGAAVQTGKIVNDASTGALPTSCSRAMSLIFGTPASIRDR
jgi:hypothetical protein